ncbi:unnamed protein product, partial [Timema podura]|nr:unnamed protein product [Timema podura]
SFYGDALTSLKGDFKQCQCYWSRILERGFGPWMCNQMSGQCQCKPNIKGNNCDQCKDDSYSIVIGEVMAEFDNQVQESKRTAKNAMQCALDNAQQEQDTAQDAQ